MATGPLRTVRSYASGAPLPEQMHRIVHVRSAAFSMAETSAGENACVANGSDKSNETECHGPSSAPLRAHSKKPVSSRQIKSQGTAVQYQRTTLIQPRKGTGLPHGYGLRMVKLIGKGSNNAVYLYRTKVDQLVVVRQPRRKSDTQRVGNATWEFRNTAIAVQLEAAPILYDAWYNRHSTSEQRGGLHMICDYFPQDVHALIMDTPRAVPPLASKLRGHVVQHLRKMSDHSLFCYDLKPSNMVFRDEPFDVRFIDFGRDFCEWRPYSDTNEYLERAPVLSYMQTIADENADARCDAKQLYNDLIYATMLIILSSNIAFTIDQSRTASRCIFAENQVLNFMASACRDLRMQIRGKHVKLIKEIIRQRDIRDTLRHYMGRRNCGTKRCFHYAGFTKAKVA